MKVSEHRTTVMVTAGLLMYFLWMDVALYYRVQSLPPPKPSSPATLDTSDHQTAPQEPPPKLFSPFTGLSVKMMMLDQVNNYIHTPLAQIFNRMTDFAKVFYFITPNMLSFMGFLSACVAAKLVMHDSLGMHRLAILMFCVRTWFDALDGLVARERQHIAAFVSLRDTSGYVVDGVADACGFSVFLTGCFFYLKRKLPSTKMYLPMSRGDHEKSRPSSYMPFSTRRVALVVGCFALQLAVSCIFWDHYISEYHDLLEVPSSINPHEQAEVLRSSLMWVVLWFWRVSNAHSLMHIFLWFIFTDRMWDFLVMIQWIGMAWLTILIGFTELHLRSVSWHLRVKRTRTRSKSYCDLSQCERISLLEVACSADGRGGETIRGLKTEPGDNVELLISPSQTGQIWRHRAPSQLRLPSFVGRSNASSEVPSIVSIISADELQRRRLSPQSLRLRRSGHVSQNAVSLVCSSALCRVSYRRHGRDRA
ncbi:hypothetical protein BIW11_08543 [Tropilaelaps mercedesae]|uniref:Ceramide phosphoethanolamine synthase-like n=1 Tax=Tropilaelaps mercedesae TaxID=418985 RepID=A0A1V9XP54_9ACAR|nr:hypothetical protein BIW11_08543 [Tropilaelaps mercedesae]